MSIPSTAHTPHHPAAEQANHTHGNNSTSPTTIQGINAPRMSIHQMQAALNAWVAHGTKSEKRAEAAEKILNAYQTNVTQLDISHLYLTSLPDCIGQLLNVQMLNLGYNQLQYLSEVGNLSHLQELWLHGNQLQHLPNEIGNLSHLQKLYLNYNQLQHLPNAIGNLSNLQTLTLEDNQLQHLPNQIGNLSNLQRLYLKDNQLQHLPSEIGNLSNLQALWLQDNKLQHLPKEICNLSNLQRLDLSYNKLQHLPNAIGDLRNLQRLDLDHNQLQHLPKEIGNLSNLQELWLQDNQLQHLPNAIGNLSNLQWLSLRNNQLQDLPNEIGNLSKLHTLDLRYNPFTTLPATLARLTKLKYLTSNDRAKFDNITHLPTALRAFQQKFDIELGHAELRDEPEQPNAATQAEVDALKAKLSELAASLQQLAQANDQQAQTTSELATKQQALQTLQAQHNTLSQQHAKAFTTCFATVADAQASLGKLQGLLNLNPATLVHRYPMPKALLAHTTSLGPKEHETFKLFFNTTFMLMQRAWMIHTAAACEIKTPDAPISVRALEALCKAAPIPGGDAIGGGTRALVEYVMAVKANKEGLKLMKHFHSVVQYDETCSMLAGQLTHGLQNVLIPLQQDYTAQQNQQSNNPNMLTKAKQFAQSIATKAQQLNVKYTPVIEDKHPVQKLADQLVLIMLNPLLGKVKQAPATSATNQTLSPPEPTAANFTQAMVNYLLSQITAQQLEGTVVGTVAGSSGASNHASAAASALAGMKPLTVNMALYDEPKKPSAAASTAASTTPSNSAAMQTLQQTKSAGGQVAAALASVAPDPMMQQMQAMLMQMMNTVQQQGQSVLELKTQLADQQTIISKQQAALTRLAEESTEAKTTNAQLHQEVKAKSTTIAALEQAVEAARSVLNTAQQEAFDAKQAAIMAQRDAELAKQQAENAETTAQRADSKSDEAHSTAQRATSDAQTAIGKTAELDERVSLLGLSKSTASQMQFNIGRNVLTQAMNGAANDGAANAGGSGGGSSAMAAGPRMGQAGGANAQVVQHLAAEVSGLRQQVHATARTVAGLEQNDARRARAEAERELSKNSKGLISLVTRLRN